MPAGVTRCLSCSATLARSCGRRHSSKASANSIGFADAQQELRLRDELLRLHAVFFRGRGERGEVHVGGDVLLAGGFVGIGADGVLANGLQRSAMASGQLLLAGVAVVDDEDESAFEAGCDALM